MLTVKEVMEDPTKDLVYNGLYEQDIGFLKSSYTWIHPNYQHQVNYHITACNVLFPQGVSHNGDCTISV